MKIKLKPLGQPSGDAPTPSNAPAEAGRQAASASSTHTPAAPKLNLKFKSSNAGAHPESVAESSADAPKKRKYIKKVKMSELGQPASSGVKPKKRALEDGEEGAPVKRKPKPTFKSLERADSDDDDDDDVPSAPPVRGPPHRSGPTRNPSVKLSLKPKGPGQIQRSGTAIIKMKAPGKPPYRPPGVGYDSEAEEAEVDPAIESQFVLRMEPGPDCDLLRRSIEEKTLGKKPAEGGPGVRFRFLDREGRRVILTIQDRMYAASMVELPCVIESLKSWNKKDWVKSADICQMLLVLGRVNSEEEAKKFPRPKTVEPNTHRYAHGLTPPMQHVRGRRFKQRKSYLDIERIESEANNLLLEDEKAASTKYDLIESENDDSSGEDSYDEQDAPGEDDDMFDQETPAADIMDAADLEEALAQGLMEGIEVEDANGEDLDIDGLFGGGGGGDDATFEMETPIATPHDVAMHALNYNANLVLEPESIASTPAAATSADDDDEGDDEDEEDDEDEVDPEVAAKLEQDEQIRGEIRELEDAIADSKNQLAQTSNILWKRRLQDRIDNQEKDRQVKLSLLGEQAEDD
jgi:transcription initiation factor TFIID subunit 7